MTGINWTEHVLDLASRAQYATGWEAPWSAECDPGDVAPRVMPALCGLAQRIGFSVRLSDDLPQDVLGHTLSSLRSREGLIEIRAGMSPASTARVTGHELGHALHHHNTSLHELRNQAVVASIVGPSMQEEAACELGTGAFCRAMGIGTGQFLLRYMGQHLGRQRVRTSAIHEGAALAEALWAATHEHALAGLR